MSIRLKLFLVIVILITSFVVSAATYFILLAPLQKISDEEESLTSLHTSFLVQELAAQRLATSPFTGAVKDFKLASASTTEAFLAVQGLKVLPSLNDSIRQSLATINKLKTQLDQNMLQFRDDVQTISNVFDRFPAIHPDQATLFGLVVTATRANEVEGTGQVLGVSEVETWIAQLDVVSKGFADAGAVIDKQYASIETEVRMVENRSRLLSLLVVAVLIGLTVLLASFVSNRIVRAIRSIEHNIFLMKEGDLTLAFSLDVQDEVGALSRNLDEFLAGLRNSMDMIKSTSEENLKIKETLVATTEETSASATQISSNAASIDRGIGTLDDHLSNAGSSVEKIAASIQELNQQIQEQMSMVEESTASVTQMITSMNNIANITEKRREATDRLMGTVTEGGRRIAATFEGVTRINKSVENIKDITGVIQSLSAQTNLLAMNAAIEAAHAGAAGHGFSVVATEIRKLAEASAQNSKRVSGNLQEIINSVSGAGEASREMDDSFREIETETRELHSSLEEISASMRELRSGGQQILEAMSILQDVSSHVRSGSGDISGNAESIREAMGVIRQISAEVRNGMVEIAGGIGEISNAVQHVMQVAEESGRLGQSLNGELGHFKTS